MSQRQSQHQCPLPSTSIPRFLPNPILPPWIAHFDAWLLKFGSDVYCIVDCSRDTHRPHPTSPMSLEPRLLYPTYHLHFYLLPTPGWFPSLSFSFLYSRVKGNVPWKVKDQRSKVNTLCSFLLLFFYTSYINEPSSICSSSELLYLNVRYSSAQVPANCTMPPFPVTAEYPIGWVHMHGSHYRLTCF